MNEKTWSVNQFKQQTIDKSEDESWGQLIAGTSATVLTLALLWATL